LIVIIVNFCRNFMKIIFKGIVMNITYSQVTALTGRPSCSGKVNSIAAVDVTEVNSIFKQFVIAVDSYAATNTL